MISILAPTRNRRDNIVRLWESVQDTAKDPSEIELIIYVDDDDNSYEDLGIPVTIVKGPRIVLSEMWNKCYEQAEGPIFMHCGDDIIFRTEGWDNIVKSTFAEYPDRIAFVFGRDGSVHDGNFGTHGFIHRNWVEAVGYFVPPYFVSDYNDTWLNDVAKMIGRHRHIDILTEHMHYAFGKAELDQTHRERLDRDYRENPGQIYAQKNEERQRDAEKLRKVMYV